MSTTALIVSSFLLVVLLFVRHYEYSRRNTRVFELFRTKLDRMTRVFFRYLGKRAKQFLEYLHKDVVLNILHMVTYVALFIVRVIERRLERITIFLRSFKKRKKRSKREIQNESEHIS